MIESQLAESGCSITESKELGDRGSGKGREVDVVIEGRVGEHDVTVSVECTRMSQPATSDWIERMHVKHESLSTNKLLLVSETAFTPDALSQAERRGIRACSIEEASVQEWRVEMNLQEIALQHGRLYPTRFTIRGPASDRAVGPGFKVSDCAVLVPLGATRVGASALVEEAMAHLDVRDAMSSDTTGSDHWRKAVLVEFAPGPRLNCALAPRRPASEKLLASS